MNSAPGNGADTTPSPPRQWGGVPVALTGDDLLSELLVRQGVVQPSEMDRARMESRHRDLCLRDALTGLNICLEDEINWAISRALNIPFVLLSREMVEEEVIGRFPLELLTEVRAVPITDAGGGVTLVMADPLDERSFQKVEAELGGELGRAVAPSGRVLMVLDEVQRARGSRTAFVSETVVKDTSGVAAVYGMLVAGRRRGANRLLIRPAGDGLEAAFRLERGWVVHRTWAREQALSVLTRCRIMMGLPPATEGARERAILTTRINNERISVEAEFLQYPAGGSVDIQIYPIISSSSLQELTSLNEPHRSALLGLFTARRPTGVLLVNAADQRQRYRMIHGLTATLLKAKLDVLTIEERKFLETPGVRRFEVRSESALWDDIVQQQSDVIAVTDTPFWRWRELIGSAGERLLILGLDLANSWLAFRSFLEVISAPALAADRLRAVWSGRRVDLTCTTCGGRVDPERGRGLDRLCPACDGYGHDRGADLFEVVVPDEWFRTGLAGRPNWIKLHGELGRVTVAPSIEQQLRDGIAAGTIFNTSELND